MTDDLFSFGRSDPPPAGEPYSVSAAAPETVAASPHNPDGLTREEVGVDQGWRLLDEGEVKHRRGTESAFEVWVSDPSHRCFKEVPFGCCPWLTYRTKLTRDAVAILP